MKYLGIDYGPNHLGLAVSDGLFAEPYRQKDKGQRTKDKGQIKNLKFIKSLTESEKIEEIVMGLPGGKMGEKVKKFGEELRKITGLPVKYIDETLTSQEAVRKMIESGRGKKFRQEEEHNIAACIILQEYLDTRI